MSTMCRRKDSSQPRKWLVGARGSRRLIAALGVLLLVASSVEAFAADTMRCGRQLVSVGDSRYEVRSSCGDPDDEQSRVELRTVVSRVRVPCGEGKVCWRSVSRTVEVQVDEWLYDFGALKFIQHLTFEQGKLVRVEDGGRGRKR